MNLLTSKGLVLRTLSSGTSANFSSSGGLLLMWGGSIFQKKNLLKILVLNIRFKYEENILS